MREVTAMRPIAKINPGQDGWMKTCHDTVGRRNKK
jgi:hypothetical protein